MPETEPKRNALNPTERLARAMEKQTSFGYRFLLGVVTGIGTALGATLIASILVYFLVQFIQTIGWEEMLNSWKEDMKSELIEDAKENLRR